jgi:hypothetical protein
MIFYSTAEGREIAIYADRVRARVWLAAPKVFS